MPIPTASQLIGTYSGQAQSEGGPPNLFTLCFTRVKKTNQPGAGQQVLGLLRYHRNIGETMVENSFTFNFPPTQTDNTGSLKLTEHANAKLPATFAAQFYFNASGKIQFDFCSGEGIANAAGFAVKVDDDIWLTDPRD